MKAIELNETCFCGAASIESIGDGFRPWRLPHRNRHLFSTPDEQLLLRAVESSGVRMRLKTDTTRLNLRFKPLGPVNDAAPQGHPFDAVVDNEIVQVVRCGEGDTGAAFDRLGAGLKIVEIWFPPTTDIILTGIEVNTCTSARPAPDRRPLWITWGSSLTHCVRAGSAARTWPATVARANDLNLLNLGFRGHCCLDPTVAMYIRDMPADYISMKLGINTFGKGIQDRIYAALMTGVLNIILEKHRHTPVALISPIAFPPHETTANISGYTITEMRRDMDEICNAFRRAGANSLLYVSGLEIFTEADIQKHTSDQCHPKSAGIDLMAERFNEHVMPLLLGET